MPTNPIPDHIEGVQALHWIAFRELVDVETARCKAGGGFFEKWGTLLPHEELTPWLEHVVEGRKLANGDWPEKRRRRCQRTTRELRRKYKATNAELLELLRHDLTARSVWKERIDAAERDLFAAARRGTIGLLGQRVEKGAKPDGSTPFEPVPAAYLHHRVAIHLPSNKLTFDYSAPVDAVAGWSTNYANLRVPFDDLMRLWPGQIEALTCDATLQDRARGGGVIDAFEKRHWNLGQTLAWVSFRDPELVRCQSASNFAPLSARNIDPPLDVTGGAASPVTRSLQPAQAAPGAARSV